MHGRKKAACRQGAGMAGGTAGAAARFLGLALGIGGLVLAAGCGSDKRAGASATAMVDGDAESPVDTSVGSDGPARAADVDKSGDTGGSAVTWWTPDQYAARLGVGLDVDWAKTIAGRAAYSVKMVEDFKAKGLGHVRLRVKDDVSPDLLAQIDAEVADCLAHGLVPVLAYQADAFKTAPTPANAAAAVAWWQAVASHLASAGPDLSFDLIIEVTDALNDQPDTLNAFYASAVAAIRQSNPQRMLFISPRIRSAPEHLTELVVPAVAGPNLMAEWHFYAAGPSKTSAAKLWTTGTAAEKQLITDKIALALAWQKATGRRSWVGAWMPGNYNDANDYSVPEQVAFSHFVSCQLQQAAIPYAVNSDTKFYDRDKQAWIADMAPVLSSFLAPQPCP